MAKDIKIDFTTGKLLNETIDGQDRVIQQCKLALRIIKGEWELDSDYGISIFSDEKATILANEVKIMLEQIDGVILVKNVEANESFNSSGQGEIIINAIIQTDTDVIRIQERLS